MVASHRATIERKSSPSLLNRENAATSGVFGEDSRPPPSLRCARRWQGALHRLRYNHRRAFVEMNAVRPTQLAPVYFDGQPSIGIWKRGVNNLPRGRGRARAFDLFGIRQLEQEHPRAALLHHPDQLL